MRVRTRGAELEAQAIGDAGHPCVILVMGAQASMLWWPLEFCEMLAARGRYVLRFDHRDTGLSTKFPVGAPGYTSDDLADDVVAILDSFKVARAQWVGVSMGGHMLEFGRVLAAGEDFDEKAARALIEADFDRSAGFSHGTNHYQVQGGESWAKLLPEMKPPMVVLHGRALAKAVPGATLVEFPGGTGWAGAPGIPSFMS